LAGRKMRRTDVLHLIGTTLVRSTSIISGTYIQVLLMQNLKKKKKNRIGNPEEDEEKSLSPNVAVLRGENSSC